jgi:hypothetical protein
VEQVKYESPISYSLTAMIGGNGRMISGRRLAAIAARLRTACFYGINFASSPSGAPRY